MMSMIQPTELLLELSKHNNNKKKLLEMAKLANREVNLLHIKLNKQKRI